MLANRRRHSKRNRLDRARAGRNPEAVTKPSEPKDEARPARPSTAAREKEARLAAALRANLRRRKEAAKSAAKSAD